MPDSPRRGYDRGDLRTGGSGSRSVDSRHPDDDKHADIRTTKLGKRLGNLPVALQTQAKRKTRGRTRTGYKDTE